jgi:hypothetical protein
VGGLAESNPAVLGDRRWFSGEEICSADGEKSKHRAQRLVSAKSRLFACSLFAFCENEAQLQPETLMNAL